MQPGIPHDDEELRAIVERLCRFDSTTGSEREAQLWLRDRFEAFGFEPVTWTANADRLAGHPSFPNDPAALSVDDRPNVAGVVDLGTPDRGPTLVLNGHVDVVPAESTHWSVEPFEPTWDDHGSTMTARGAADMKAGLGACIGAARRLAERRTDLDGRVVIESVVGEEEGGIGAADAALSNPYPFERDAAITPEPTSLRPVIATEGSLMKRLRIEGRSAHAATRWLGESVLPHFHRIHDALLDLEAERADRVTHPLYDRFEIPWPINVGTVSAGNWASTVPAELEAEIRIGVAPMETVDGVEAEVDDLLDGIVETSPWLRRRPPSFDRFGVQFEPAEIDPTEPVVTAIGAALRERDRPTRPVGATYGADARHYIAAGIPTVLFGPGDIAQAHYPDESIDWSAVRTATDVITAAAERFLATAG